MSNGFTNFTLIAMALRGGGRNQKSVRRDFGSAVWTRSQPMDKGSNTQEDEQVDDNVKSPKKKK